MTIVEHSQTVDLPDLFRNCGDELSLASGATRVFDDPDSVWLICEGSVDLLAIERKNDHPTGAREHLATLKSGSLIWGMRQFADRDGIHILGLSAGASRLLRIPSSEIGHLTTVAAGRHMLAAALNQWVVALSRGGARYISPRRAPERAVSADEAVTLVEGERINSRKGVVWLELDRDGGNFLDVVAVEAPSRPAMVPLVPQTWLEATRPQEAIGKETDLLLWSPELAHHMERFHGWILHALSIGFRNAAALEAARLARSAEKVAGDTQRTLFNFATLLDEELSTHGGHTADNALFDCCSLVARDMGMTPVMPTWAKRRRAEDKPLDVEEIALASLMRVRQIVLRGRWWEQDNGPMVGYRADDNRPLALLPRGGRRYVAYDPIAGEEKQVTEAMAEGMSSLAHYFYATLPNRPLSVGDLLRFGLAPCRNDLLMLAFSGALGGLVATGVPLVTGYVFDTVIPGHQSPQMIQVALALLAAAISAAAFHVSSDVALLRIEGKMAGRLQAAVMDRLLRLPDRFCSDFSSGDLAQRTMMVELIRRALTGTVLTSIVTGVFSVFSFGLLFYYAPVVALIACLLTLILGGAAVVAGIGLMRATMLSETLSGKISSLVLEMVTGIAKLRLAGAEERAFNVWGTKFFEMRKRQVDMQRAANGYAVFWAGFEIIGLAIIFGAVAVTSGGQVTTGNFLAFIAAFTGFMTAASSLARSIIALFGVSPLYQRSAPILHSAPEIDVSKSDPGILRGDIEMNGVTFRYAPEGKYILNGLSLKASTGEFIAITGPSGSGKSTLVRLLLGFEQAESGGIFYDGRDLRGLSLQRVRRQIGVVLQTGKLIPGSIFENIQGSTQATIEECWEAAALAGLDAEIGAMPMGMHTVLTEGATALSGGQVQRILIARAIVGKPRLMVMDEATSALDNRTQSIVTQSLDKLSITRIVIAHRLSTIVNADRIYVLNQGQVAEVGNYDQLMSMNGVFADLARRQQI